MSLTGAKIGSYSVAELIGRGGMAEVYKVKHTELDVDRVIKVIRSEYATSPDFRVRFQREAQAAARIDHPNIVTVHDFGTYDGQFYMVLQHVDGEDLAQLIRRDGPMPEWRATALVAQIANALEYAHQQDLVHRDIKPDNIMIDATGSPIIMDFGIAKLKTAATSLTGTGVSIGTPAYMAPEQINGEEVTAASDIYALSVMLFEMLTGSQPYKAETPIAVMMKAMSEPLPPLSEFGVRVSALTESVIAKGTHKEAQQRYSSAKEFADVLTENNTLEPTVVVAPPKKSVSKAWRLSPLEWTAVIFLPVAMIISAAVWWIANSG